MKNEKWTVFPESRYIHSNLVLYFQIWKFFIISLRVNIFFSAENYYLQLVAFWDFDHQFYRDHRLYLYKIDSYPTWYCLLRRGWRWGITLKRAKSIIILRDHQLLSHLLILKHDFWRKIFLLLYSINWLNFIVWLPLLCEILGNMCIIIFC